MSHITNAKIVDSQGNEVSEFAGVLSFDEKNERDDGYGNANSVRAVIAAVDDKGRGLSIVYSQTGKSVDPAKPVEKFDRKRPIVIRNCKLKPPLIWFHCTDQ